jgi:hypothetical protein
MKECKTNVMIKFPLTRAKITGGWSMMEKRFMSDISLEHFTGTTTLSRGKDMNVVYCVICWMQ